MKECRYTMRRCDNPHLLCKACPNYVDGTLMEDALKPAPRLPRLPDPAPFVKIGANPSGSPGVSITIGVKGTF